MELSKNSFRRLVNKEAGQIFPNEGCSLYHGGVTTKIASYQKT